MPNAKLSVLHCSIVVGRRDKSLKHELRVMGAAELHVNATYCIYRISLWKSEIRLWKKPISIGGTLFFSCSIRTVFEVAEGL